MKNLTAAVFALASLAAPALAAPPPTRGAHPPAGLAQPGPLVCVPMELECVRVECEAECWEVRVSYESAEGPQQTPTGGLWGSISGARCHADKVASRGFWLDPASALQPTKVPPGALRLVVIDRAFPDR